MRVFSIERQTKIYLFLTQTRNMKFDRKIYLDNKKNIGFSIIRVIHLLIFDFLYGVLKVNNFDLRQINGIRETENYR